MAFPVAVAAAAAAEAAARFNLRVSTVHAKGSDGMFPSDPFISEHDRGESCDRVQARACVRTAYVFSLRARWTSSCPQDVQLLAG